MIIYIARSDGGYAKYEGMDLETVMALLNDLGLTGEVIDEQTHKTAVAKFKLDTK